MPLHDVGYREWDGPRVGPWKRWWMITETGVRITLKSAWVRRIIFFCWLPIFYWGIGLFAFEQINLSTRDKVLDFEQQQLAEDVAESKEFQKSWESELEDAKSLARQRVLASTLKDQFRGFPAIEQLADKLASEDSQSLRHTFWTWLLMTYFRYPQSVALIFLLGFITPSLISRDIRSRAMLLYFSRPIGRIEYLVGKFMIPAFFLIFVTMLPALALYCLGVVLSPEISIVLTTWDIPLRIMLATVVVVVPAVSLSLMLSSLTQESRFAAFAWFAIWALGQGAWFAVLISTSIQKEISPTAAAQLPEIRRFSGVSLYNNLGNVQSWIFGFESDSIALTSFLILLGVTVFSLLILYRRISKATHA